MQAAMSVEDAATPAAAAINVYISSASANTEVSEANNRHTYLARVC